MYQSEIFHILGKYRDFYRSSGTSHMQVHMQRLLTKHV